MTAKIMVVEDDKIMANLIGLQLVHAGYDAEVVHDGETALKLVANSQVDLIILDIMLPGIDGVEICRRLRKMEALAGTPIIMLTSLTDIIDKERGFKAGADDYLTKPFDRAELKLRVEAHLKRVDRDVDALAKLLKRKSTLSVEMLSAPGEKAGTGRSRFMLPPDKDTPRVSVIIPTLNEADNMPELLPWIPEWVDEVILVDGRSTDGTLEVARAIYPEIRIVVQKGKGKGDALQAGFEAAQGDIIIMLDADGSTDPAEIPAFVGTLLGGADFAKGSRFLQGGGTLDMPFYRRLGNWLFVMVVRLLFGGTYSDLLYGYNAFWTRVLPLIKVDVPGFEVETLMNIRALRAGLKIAEVPSFESARLFGIPKLRAFPDGWKVLMTILREYYSHRVRRENLQRQGVVEEDRVFSQAVGAIFREALQLWRGRTHLPMDYYKSALGSIRDAYRTLLDSEFSHPDDNYLRDYYHERYGREVPWAFVEKAEASQTEAAPPGVLEKMDHSVLTSPLTQTGD